MKRFLQPCGVCFIILLVAFGGFWYWINISPKVDIPTPQIPNPNGYDYFIKAGKVFVPNEKGIDTIIDGKWKERLASEQAWLQENTQALQLLREGLKYPTLQPPSVETKNYSHFRDLARLIAVEIHIQAERDNWNGAANSGLEGLKFGYAIAQGGPLIAGLTGNAIEAIILREMYQISPHLNANSAKQIAKKMEHLYANRFSYAETMQEEKWRGQTQNIAMMRGKNWRLRLVSSLSYPTQVIVRLKLLDKSYIPPSHLETAKEFLKYSRIFVMRKKTLMNNYTKILDAVIANGQVPYKDVRPILKSEDPLVDLLISIYKDTRWNWERMNAYCTLNMTMFALHAYKLDHGNYPNNLQELVPIYLQKIPTDPFDGVRPLCYKLRSEKYVLWSIGPDGVNNNGTPIENKGQKGKAHYQLLHPKDKGDVVAGINIP